MTMTLWADPLATWEDPTVGWGVTLSGGGIPVDATIPVLATHRGEAWHWDLYDGSENLLGALDGVSSGRLEFSIFNTIRGGGTLTFHGVNHPDWITARVQPWYTAVFVDGTTWSTPLGMFLCAAPTERYTSTGVEIEVELYDKLLVLDQDKIEDGFTVAAGVVVTDTVSDLIAATPGAGSHIAVVDSAATLLAPMVWEAGTSTLAIVNDLLAAINYFSLWVDGYGTFRADPYVAPAYRPVAYAFSDGENSIYGPEFTFEFDDFDTPNKVILVGRSDDGETEGMTSVVTNTDPLSRTSFNRRGRWIALVESGVEATSQSVLDAIAARRLADAAQTAAVLSIRHAVIPLLLNDVVTFVRDSNVQVSVRAVVQSMSFTTDVGTLVETQIRQVVS